MVAIDMPKTTKVPPDDKKYYFHTSSEYEDKPDDQLNSSALWGGLKQDTTAHGIPHYAHARGIVKKCFWGFIGACCTVALFYNIGILSYQFFTFPVNVIIEMQYERELTFPAVTICNSNPLRLSKAQLYPQIMTLFNQTNDTSVKLEELLSEKLAELSREEKMILGHQPGNMILECQYAGYYCYWKTDFVNFFNPVQGNCYIFNSGWTSNGTTKTSKKTGRRYGLKVTLNIEQDEYMDHVGESAGVMVVIHDQNRMAFPEDESFVVTPGHLTSVGVRQVYVSRLGNPYGKCATLEESQLHRNVYEEWYPVRYSMSSCFKTCYQSYVIQRCGCSDAMYPTNGTSLHNSQDIVSICESENVTQANCKKQVSDDYNQNKLNCDCPTECSERSYSLTVSTSQWPSDVHKENLLNNLKDYIPNLLNVPSDPDKYQRNLLRLEVYFEEFNFEKIAEKPAYADGQFVSDIGGVIGLWIGFSILTMFEFVEFFMDLCALRCIKRNKRKTINVAETEEKKKMEERKNNQTPYYYRNSRSGNAGFGKPDY